MPSDQNLNTPILGGKGEFKHNKLKKNNEKADKYHKNEGTNQRHRSTNK